jgi:GDPmannose 4,6-dehydratase
MVSGERTALILGISGQDGAHAAAHLLAAGWTVHGGFRRGSAAKTWRTDHLGITKSIALHNVNIDEPFNLVEVCRAVRPDIILHLAGESFVADSFAHPSTTFAANTAGTLNVLEAVRLTVPEARLFFASSSEVFDASCHDEALDEDSPMRPSNPYGISKLAAQHLVRMYRENFRLHASTGILFNHEGPLRARSFVTRKITYNLARLAHAGGEAVELGGFSAARDWGAAEDYTRAMLDVLDLPTPDDYVFATGRLTSVRRFLELAASAAGFRPRFEGEGADERCIDATSGRTLARVSAHYFRPFDTSARRGNARKLEHATGWKGSRPVETLAEEMVAADLRRWKEGNTNV